MIYPYRCKNCNSISTVDKQIKDKAKFEYCGHCESDEPLKEIVVGVSLSSVNYGTKNEKKALNTLHITTKTKRCF